MNDEIAMLCFAEKEINKMHTYTLFERTCVREAQSLGKGTYCCETNVITLSRIFSQRNNCFVQIKC